MNANADILQWRAQWQRQSEALVADDFRASVVRETRRLKLALAAPVLVTVVIGGLSILRALREESLERWLLTAGVWFFIALTWTVVLFLARGTWRPRADTTAAFFEVAVRRCESALAIVPFACVLYVVELAFVMAWKYRYLPDSAAELLLSWPTVLFGWIGMPVFFAFMAHYATRKRAELANLRELRAQLQAD